MKVYKYRGGTEEAVERDIASIVSSYFWAPTVDQLNDPSEAYVKQGHIKTALRGLSFISDVAEVSSAFDTVLGMRHTAGVYSLSRTPLDELMWAYYASSHTGFCIEYNLERLMLEARTGWNVIDVSYQTDPQTIQFDDILTREEVSPMLGKMIGTKSQRWAHEREIRIITNTAGQNYYAQPALTGIYFGCRCTEEFIVNVRKRLSGRRITYYQIEFSPHSYTMKAKPIKHDAAIDGIPKSYLAPVDECAIPELRHTKEENRPFYSYLEKALEIVRRDVSCNKVVLVDFSVDRVVNGKPVIYVHYETNVPTALYNGLNQYFSIDELEDASREADESV
jgi:hypothetical protein